MNTRPLNATQWVGVLTILAVLAGSGGAVAQSNDRGAYGVRRSGAYQHFDDRYDHNHYYYDHGYTVRAVPRSGYAIDRGRDHYWFDRGQWYRRDTRGWVVIGAPLGAFLPVLPAFYTTVWVGGLPYYYANDTYYAWRGDRREYEVVDPPANIDSAATTQPPASDTLFSYPRNGQSATEQANDRYECHRSAVDQTHYDPTQAGGGVAPDAAAGKRADYFRAEAACLDARGYSVR